MCHNHKKDEIHKIKQVQKDLLAISVHVGLTMVRLQSAETRYSGMDTLGPEQCPLKGGVLSTEVDLYIK